MFNLKISGFFPEKKDQLLQRRFFYIEQITKRRRLLNIVYLMFATEKFPHSFVTLALFKLLAGERNY